jgi:hypothetical protein
LQEQHQHLSFLHHSERMANLSESALLKGKSSFYESEL